MQSTFNSGENLQLLVIIKADDWSCRRGSTDKIRRMGCDFDSAEQPAMGKLGPNDVMTTTFVRKIRVLGQNNNQDRPRGVKTDTRKLNNEVH